MSSLGAFPMVAHAERYGRAVWCLAAEPMIAGVMRLDREPPTDQAGNSVNPGEIRAISLCLS